MYELEPITDRFLMEAPLIIPASVHLPDHSPEQVWEALGSDRMWSWFPAIDRLRWLTPEPREAGCIRELRIGRAVTVREEFYRWDEGRRATFRVTHQSRRLLRGLAEDFLLDPQTGGGTHLTWTMCLAPAGPTPPRVLANALLPGNRQAIKGIRKILPPA